MSLRNEWILSDAGFEWVEEPYLNDLKKKLKAFMTKTLFPKLYFSYDAGTQQTTIMTTDLNQMHLRMVQYLKTLPDMANQPECAERLVQLVTRCVAVVVESFGATIEHWDYKVMGLVCCGEP